MRAQRRGSPIGVNESEDRFECSDAGIWASEKTTFAVVEAKRLLVDHQARTLGQRWYCRGSAAQSDERAG